MSPKATQQWNTRKINNFNKQSQQALLSDESTLVSFSQDFGKLFRSSPMAVYQPHNNADLQNLIFFANQNQLPVVIRAKGLSQCGQSLPVAGGVTLSMEHFSKTLDLEQDAIWVEANASWASLLEVSLKESKAPFVLPYNCNLSIAGVLSAGGVGASSFKHGFINAHVQALEVIDGTGCVQIVDKNSSLFNACLSGQGRCAVITKAKINLKPVQAQVKTFSLVYADPDQWFEDIEKVKAKTDYMELFCSPSVQGAKLKQGKRVALAQWLYGMHVSVEYTGKAPELTDICPDLAYWNILNIQEESIDSYFLRHNPRFEMMKMLGQWDLFHPWYECFVPTQVLVDYLPQIIEEIPIHYASLVHVVPIAKQKAQLLMLPEEESVSEFMILNPGIPLALKDSCLQAVRELDAFFLHKGGKRYLSGYLGEITQDYWVNHFNSEYAAWMDFKKQYDPAGVFNSVLYKST